MRFAVNDAELAELTGLSMDPLFFRTNYPQAFFNGPGRIHSDVASEPETESGGLNLVLELAVTEMIVGIRQTAAAGIECRNDRPALRVRHLVESRVSVTDADLFGLIIQNDLVNRFQVGIEQLIAELALRNWIHSGASVRCRCGTILSACETAWHLNQLN
jgi:hypothetical protein